MPLILAIEPKAIRSNSLRGLKRERLAQQGKVCIGVGQINPALIESQKALGKQSACAAPPINVEIPLSLFDVRSETKFLLTPGLHQVSGKIVRPVLDIKSTAASESGKWQRTIKEQPSGEGC